MRKALVQLSFSCVSETTATDVANVRCMLLYPMATLGLVQPSWRSVPVEVSFQGAKGARLLENANNRRAHLLLPVLGMFPG